MKRTRTPQWMKRRDKGGGYAFVRRWEKALERRGFASVSKAVGCFVSPDGSGSLTIYRDVIIRSFRQGRRPLSKFDPRKDING